MKLAYWVSLHQILLPDINCWSGVIDFLREPNGRCICWPFIFKSNIIILWRRSCDDAKQVDSFFYLRREIRQWDHSCSYPTFTFGVILPFHTINYLWMELAQIWLAAPKDNVVMAPTVIKQMSHFASFTFHNHRIYLFKNKTYGPSWISRASTLFPATRNKLANSYDDERDWNGHPLGPDGGGTSP